MPIDTLDRDAVVAAYAAQFKPFIDVPVQWNGSATGCVAGTTSAQATDATLKVLNYLRNMAGVEGVELDPAFNSKAQEAALMMHAQNSLSHLPGANWACYSEAGAQGAGASNLSLGMTGPAAMVGYVEDQGMGNHTVGHRRWLLNPNIEKMGIGSTSNTNALYVSAPIVNRPAPEWMPWPPQGFVPKELVFPRWSLSRANADFSQATVQMTAYGQNVQVVIPQLGTNIALNTLVWEPQINFDLVSAEEMVIDVSVNNVRVNGVPTSFQYTVTPIQPGPALQTIAAAQDDRVEMNAGQTNFFFSIVANDNLTHAGWAPATPASITPTIVAEPKNGRVLPAIGSSGTFFYFPNPGFVGVDTFTYRLADLDAGRVSNLATVQVNVRGGSSPTSQSPTISTIADQAATSGNTTDAVSFLIGDPDSNLESLVVTATSANQTLIPPQNITLGGSGANRTVTVRPSAGQTGLDAITIWVSDGQNSAFESFVVTVAPSQNTKIDPVITWNAPAPIVVGTTLSTAQLNATANVPGTLVYDPALGTALSVGSAQPLRVTFTPTDTVNYNTVSKTVTIDVTQRNDPPVNRPPQFAGGGIVAIGASRGPYQEVWATGVLPGPPDALDELASQTVRFELTSSTGNASQLLAAAPTIDSQGILRFSPQPTAFGQLTYNVVAIDSLGARSAPAVLAISLADNFAAPTLIDGATGTHLGRALTIRLSDYIQPTGVPIDFQSFEIVGPPQNGSITSIGDGTVRYDGIGGFVGSDSLAFTVRDRDGRISNRASISIRVVSSPLQNAVESWDVDNDKNVIPLDALLVLNFVALQRRDPQVVPVEFQAPFYDVNGDRNIQPLDALVVLNEIARRRQVASGSAEGESFDPLSASFAFFGSEGDGFDEPDYKTGFQDLGVVEFAAKAQSKNANVATDWESESPRIKPLQNGESESQAGSLVEQIDAAFEQLSG